VWRCTAMECFVGRRAFAVERVSGNRFGFG
jgi:hypothetical protein